MGRRGRSASVLLAVNGALPANLDDPATETGGSVRGNVLYAVQMCRMPGHPRHSNIYAVIFSIPMDGWMAEFFLPVGAMQYYCR